MPTTPQARLLFTGAQAKGDPRAVDAAALRGHHPISISDSSALATTRHLRGTVASFVPRLLKAASPDGIATT